MQAVRDSMQLEDARSLSSGAQQVLRKRAIVAVVQQQRPQGQVAEELGVACRTVNRWVQRYRARGEPALAARKQGGPPHRKLNRKQLAQTTRLIRDQAPEN